MIRQLSLSACLGLACGAVIAEESGSPLTYGDPSTELFFDYAVTDPDEVAVVPDGPAFAVVLSMTPEVAMWVEGITGQIALMGDEGAGFHWALCGARLEAPGLKGAITGGRIVIDGGYSETEARALQDLLLGIRTCGSNDDVAQ